MTNPVTGQYRRWFECEKDAHAKVLASFAAVPDPLRLLPSYDQALGLMMHIVEARRLWLFRLGVGKDAPRSAAEFFPKGLSLPDVVPKVDAMHGTWSLYLSKLTDPDAAGIIEYSALDGGKFRNTVEDILAQLHGHSSYHRGQIALLIRLLGAEPATTDFVFWARTKIGLL